VRLQHGQRDITLKGHGPLLGILVHQLQQIYPVDVAPLLDGLGQQANVVLVLLEVVQIRGLPAADVALDEDGEGLGALGVLGPLSGTGCCLRHQSG